TLMKKLFLLLGILLATATNLAAEPLPECLADKYSRYSEAQESWQHSVTQLAIELAPRYEGVAQMYLADQLLRIEQARLAVHFLAHQRPKRLRTDLSLNNWLSLNDVDEQQIAAASQRYTELLERSTASHNRAPHPDGDR